MSRLKDIHIGAAIDKQLSNDISAEQAAIGVYNSAIGQAAEAGDNGRRELLESILADEEAHLDWLESQLEQIQQMGIENCLSLQVQGDG